MIYLWKMKNIAMAFLVCALLLGLLAISPPQRAEAAIGITINSFVVPGCTNPAIDWSVLYDNTGGATKELDLKLTYTPAAGVQTTVTIITTYPPSGTPDLGSGTYTNTDGYNPGNLEPGTDVTLTATMTGGFNATQTLQSCAPPDSDNDGVPDGSDVCPGFDDNVDTDSDATPDGCDPDDDNDGVDDTFPDACPTTPLNDAVNVTADGCPDADQDGVQNSADNCPNDANADQADTDGDNIGDVCDTGIDTDGDGIEDGADNCPNDANADQADADGDSTGDVCDSTPNGGGTTGGGTTGGGTTGGGTTGGGTTAPPPPPPPTPLIGNLFAGDQVRATANVRLRSEPGFGSNGRPVGEILDTIPFGAVVKVLGIDPTKEWYLVEYDGKTGWTSAAYFILPDGEEVFNFANRGPGIGFARAIGNVRVRATTSLDPVTLRPNGAVVGQVPYGGVVQILDQDNRGFWWFIRYGNVEGWVVVDWFVRIRTESTANNEETVAVVPVRVLDLSELGSVGVHTAQAIGNVNMRFAPNLDAPLMGKQVQYGELVVVKGINVSGDFRNGLWWLIEYDGVSGWVANEWFNVID